MAFYWLKYRIGSRASAGTWQWKPIGTFASKKEAQHEADDVIEYIDQHENLSEEPNRLKASVVDWAPTRVISRCLQAAEAQIEKATSDARLYTILLSQGEGKDCPQCKDAEDARWQSSSLTYRRSRGCPTCGRDVFEDTLPYLLPPEQTVALELLGVLVKGGWQPGYNKEWPLESDVKDEYGISPLQWLIDLGLAGGEASSKTKFKAYYEASEKGIKEWERLKHRLTPKKTRKAR